MYYSYNFISSVYCYCSGFMNSQHDPSRRNLVLYYIRTCLRYTIYSTTDIQQ